MKAEEITLTIGQAFDLAYRRFLETTGRELEGRRQVNQLQETVERLERQMQILRRRLQDLSNVVEPQKLNEFLALHAVGADNKKFFLFSLNPPVVKMSFFE